MDLNTLALFCVAALALTATPGPDMVLIASRSGAQGRLAGLATWAGIAMGTYLHALAAALGLSQLFLAVPLAYDVVRVLGALYLLYLAWQTLTQPAPQTSTPRKQSQTSLRMFYQGLWTNLLNPKMVLFVLALFPQFLDPKAGSVVVQIMIMASIINLFGFVINGAVILAADRAGHVLRGNLRFAYGARLVLSGVFAGLALRIACDSRD